jgi:3-oxoadipate enol-lactonase
VTVADISQAILDLLDDLGFQRLSFCGLSLGGAIGQWIAAHAPQRVERLILCSAASSFDPAPYLQRAATVRREGLADVAAQAMGRWFTPDFRTREPETVARYRAMVESIPPEGYAACCEAVAGFDAHSYLGRITAPTLVLLGAEDPVVQPEQGQALAGGIPAARLQIVERAAHLFNVERPDETDRAIAGHLEGSVHD